MLDAVGTKTSHITCNVVLTRAYQKGPSGLAQRVGAVHCSGVSVLLSSFVKWVLHWL